MVANRNNWLNLRAGPAWQGLVPSTSPFSEFVSPEMGVRAAALNLQNYPEAGADTLSEILGRWAPAGDGSNNPNAYTAFLTGRTGWDPNRPIDVRNPDEVATLFTHMAELEQGRPVDPAVVRRGVELALAGGGSGALVGGSEEDRLGAEMPTTQPEPTWLDYLLGHSPDQLRAAIPHLQGGARLASSVLGAPVDTVAGVAGAVGMDIEQPVLGSDWIMSQLGVPQPAAPTPTGQPPVQTESVDPITAFYNAMLGGGAAPASFTLPGGGYTPTPPPSMPGMVAPDYSPVRDLIAAAAPTGQPPRSEEDYLMAWLAGLGGGLGFDETGEILLGAGTGSVQNLQNIKETDRADRRAEDDQMRDYLLGAASAETGLIGAETSAEQTNQQIAHENNLAQWQYAQSEALRRVGEVQFTDTHMIHQAFGDDGQMEISLIPLNQNAPPDTEPWEYATEVLGFNPQTQPQATAAAVTARQAALSGQASMLLEQFGATPEEQQELISEQVAMMGGEADQETITAIQTQLLMQAMLQNPSYLTMGMQATGVDMSQPAEGGNWLTNLFN